MTHYASTIFSISKRTESTRHPRVGQVEVACSPAGSSRRGSRFARRSFSARARWQARSWSPAHTRDAPLFLPLALLIFTLSWAYSAPPMRLLARGLGELTTALVVTLLTPLLGFYLQSKALRVLPRAGLLAVVRVAVRCMLLTHD